MRFHDENLVFRDLVEEQKKFNIRKYCPEFEPEYASYTITTKPPYYTLNWKLNYLRRSREQELRDEAMKAARLKCHVTANEVMKCSVDNPYKETYMCKEPYLAMKRCFREEFEVEMDKRRRDVERNDEWWWKNIYDKDGEVGEQAKEPKYTYIEKVGDFCEWMLDKMDVIFSRDHK